MKNLFDEKFIVIWDTEYTCWEGCNKKGWDSKKNQYKEFVQIGAIIVDTKNFKIKEEFCSFVKPKLNKKLSKCCKYITGINQEDVNTAKNSKQVIQDFLHFIGDYNCYSYGNDVGVLSENIRLHNLQIKIDRKKFHDVKDIFRVGNISVDEFCSGNITEAFGVKNKEKMHSALSDSKSILNGLRLLSNK